MPAPYRLAGRYSEPLLDPFGNGLPGASVAVYAPGTTTPATLYTSATKATTAANPVTSAGVGSTIDALGNLTVFADPGSYDTVTTVGTRVGPIVRIVVPLDPAEAAQVGSDGKLLAGQSGTVALVDAKGDLLVGSAADTLVRLPVGVTTGHALVVDPSTATGLKWASATPANMVTTDTAQTITGAKTFGPLTVADTLRISTGGALVNASSSGSMILRSYAYNFQTLDGTLAPMTLRGNTADATETLNVTALRAGNSAVVARGAAAQTADIHQVRTSGGVVLASVSAAGRGAFTFVEGFRTLELGAVDSAGVGFRSVRVAN